MAGGHFSEVLIDRTLLAFRVPLYSRHRLPSTIADVLGGLLMAVTSLPSLVAVLEAS